MPCMGSMASPRLRINLRTTQTATAFAVLSARIFVVRTHEMPTCLPQVGCLSRLMHILGFGNASYRDDVIASTRFHRMIRRGREYGPRLAPDEALAGPLDTGEHGIHFICIAANILRQFEFVQNSWVMNTKFDALTEQSDPLIGNREKIAGCPFTNTFVAPQQSRGVRTRIMDYASIRNRSRWRVFFPPQHQSITFLATMGIFAVEPEKAVESGFAGECMKRIRIPGIVDIVSSDDGVGDRSVCAGPESGPWI